MVSLRLLNALNSEDRGLKVRFSLATIALDRESAQMSQILSSQGKNAPSNPYPHYLVRLATSRIFQPAVSSRRRFPWPDGAFSVDLPQKAHWKLTCPVRISLRNPIFRCPPLRYLPLGPPDTSAPKSGCSPTPKNARKATPRTLPC